MLRYFTASNPFVCTFTKPSWFCFTCYVIWNVLLVPDVSFSQPTAIRGQVMNSFGKGIPYASIRISGTSEGTVTNEDGFFRLILKHSLSSEVIVRSIGYRTKTVQIDSANSHISLEEDSQNLNEVVVRTDDFLRKLITHAYNSININYPDENIEMEGFYRETQKSMEGKYLYFGEAAIKLQQSGYRTSVEDAQIQLLQSRTRSFRGRDTIDNVRYYGGAYIGNWNDAVKMRKDFLNPSSYNKRYVYQLEGVTADNNGKDTVYTVSFQSRDKLNELSGKLWIDKASGAYLKIEYKDNKLSKSNPLSRVKRHSRDYLTIYHRNKEKHLVSYTSMKARIHNSNTQQSSFHEIEFVATGSKTGGDIQGAIPVKLRMNPGTLFSEVKNATTDDFQETYTVMEMDSLLKKQLETSYLTNQERGIDYEIKTERSKLNAMGILYNVLKKISFGYSLVGLWNRENQSGNIHFYEEEVIKAAAPNSISPATNISIGYSLSNLSSVKVDLSGSVLRSHIIDMRRVSYTRYLLIKKYGNPIFLTATAGITVTKIGMIYGKLRSESLLVIDNKNFDREVEVFRGSKGISGYLEAGLEYRRSRMAYFLAAAYSPWISSQTYLIFSQKKNIFSTQQAWVKTNDAAIKTSLDLDILQTYPYNVSLGIRLNL